MNVYAGPPRALTRITLRLVPLTPIHIGDGTDMRLDEYLLEEPARKARRFDKYGEEIEEPEAPSSPMLCCFDQAKAMRLMTPAQRTAFQRALDAGALGEAAKALRDAGKGAILERIPVSSRSVNELKKAFEDPALGSGQVRPFVRSGGRPYIPGSSIKGAFRTALASAALAGVREPSGGWTHENPLGAAFGLDPQRTETDPLRFLHVSDAFLPKDATLIDRVEVMHPKNPQTGKMKMHYELLPGRASERGSRVAWEVSLTIDSRAPFDRAKLFRTTSEFHWKIWTTERQRFFAASPETCQAMDRLLRTVKVGDKTMAEVGPVGASNSILLRLGRFGHFESKSLEGVRRGHFPQAKKDEDRIRKPNAWGSTRTVVRDANNKPIPFGWVIGWVVKEERA